jgi:hypothetical protein
MLLFGLFVDRLFRRRQACNVAPCHTSQVHLIVHDEVLDKEIHALKLRYLARKHFPYMVRPYVLYSLGYFQKITMLARLISRLSLTANTIQSGTAIAQAEVPFFFAMSLLLALSTCRSMAFTWRTMHALPLRQEPDRETRENEDEERLMQWCCVIGAMYNIEVGLRCGDIPPWPIGVRAIRSCARYHQDIAQCWISSAAMHLCPPFRGRE